jgi:hypothetical protein
MKILEIPNFADMTIETQTFDGRDRDQWPIFRTMNAAALFAHIENMLPVFREKELPAVISLYLHPWEFHEMPQGLIHFGEGAVLPDAFITKNTGAYAMEQLDRLLDMFDNLGAEYLTARALAECYAVRMANA